MFESSINCVLKIDSVSDTKTSKLSNHDDYYCDDDSANLQENRTDSKINKIEIGGNSQIYKTDNTKNDNSNIIDNGKKIKANSHFCVIEYNWTPTTAGQFKIVAYFNNQLLQNTTLNLKVFEKPSVDLIKNHRIALKTDEMPKILPLDNGVIVPRITMNDKGNVLYFSGHMLSKNGSIRIPLKFNLSHKKDGVNYIDASYYHALPGVYSVWINYDDKPLEDVPFRVEVVDVNSFVYDPTSKNTVLELGVDEDCYFNVSIPKDVPFLLIFLF